MKELSDLDAMPWGKHKGRPMQDIPADYLFWLWTNGSEQKAGKGMCPVADYIKKNLTVLAQEYPDGIWQ